jgi:hypothetical protein
MDAIRKKMQSLKAETEQLYATIRRYEDATKEYTARADQVIMTSFVILYLEYCRGNLARGWYNTIAEVLTTGCTNG